MIGIIRIMKTIIRIVTLMRIERNTTDNKHNIYTHNYTYIHKLDTYPTHGPGLVAGPAWARAGPPFLCNQCAPSRPGPAQA